jgi:hypothetical protein
MSAHTFFDSLKEESGRVGDRFGTGLAAARRIDSVAMPAAGRTVEM